MSSVFVQLSVTNLNFLGQDPIISCLCLSRCPFTASYYYFYPLESLLEIFLKYIPLIKPLFCSQLCATLPWLTEKKYKLLCLKFEAVLYLGIYLCLQPQLLLFLYKLIQLLKIYTHYILNVIEHYL